MKVSMDANKLNFDWHTIDMLALLTAHSLEDY